MCNNITLKTRYPLLTSPLLNFVCHAPGTVGLFKADICRIASCTASHFPCTACKKLSHGFNQPPISVLHLNSKLLGAGFCCGPPFTAPKDNRLCSSPPLQAYVTMLWQEVVQYCGFFFFFFSLFRHNTCT